MSLPCVTICKHSIQSRAVSELAHKPASLGTHFTAAGLSSLSAVVAAACLFPAPAMRAYSGPGLGSLLDFVNV